MIDKLYDTETDATELPVLTNRPRTCTEACQCTDRHDGDGGDVGSSPALRTPISFRGSLALRRPSQLGAPDKRLYEEVSGDSSSEVSDEGYRSQGHWKGAHSLKGADNMGK